MLSRSIRIGNRKTGIGVVATLTLAWSGIQAQELKLSPEDLPRTDPLNPEEAQEAFVLRPGFRIELVAAEPQIEDPVALSFAPDGSLFVCEMRGYSERRDEELGRVSRLSDRDGDGFYESATAYVEGLKWPTGVFAWDGGVFVAASPDLWYCKDTTGDGVADHREVVLTGFAEGASRLNVQALFNSLTWGPDHRIYGSTARNGGMVKDPRQGRSKALNLRSADFSFDPRTMDLRAESGTAQYGLCFGDYGQRYVCSNSQHVLAVMYSWPWNDRLRLPNPLVGIAVDGGAAEVFRISGVEPWRVVRTRWRVQGLVRGPVEGGGRAAGYFTSASGLCIYRGSAFPESYHGNLFVGDVGSNLVHRKIVEIPRGEVNLRARRAAGEESVEFLASPDNWFRPVQCQNGPDGALYVVDMYREIIEHPWSFPELIKDLLDLNSGNTRGRIWRVVPDEFARPKSEDLNALSDEELLQRFRSGNGWTRDAAQQVLHVRQAASAVATGSLEGMEEREAYTRLSSALALHGEEACQDLLGEGVKSSHPNVRKLAMQYATSGQLKAGAGDEDAWVRWEAALQSGREPDREVLHTLLEESPRDRWIGAAVLAVARQEGWMGEVLAGVSRKSEVVRLLQEAGIEELEGNDRKALSGVLEWANQAAFADGGEASERRAAWTLLAMDGSSRSEVLWKMVDEGGPGQAVLGLQALARKGGDWSRKAFARWEQLPTDARGFVLSRGSARDILDALEAGTLEALELGFQKKQALRTSKDRKLRARALKLLGEETSLSREEAALAFRSALDLAGESSRGATVFAERCALCHPTEAGKASTGPDLRSFVNKGKPMLLENLISPNREVAPQYQAWKVTTEGEEELLGILVRETGETITLRLAGGVDREVERSRIRKLINTNLSLMPSGLEAGLSLQQMADLLAFLKGE